MLRITRHCLVVLILSLLMTGTITIPVFGAPQRSGPTAAEILEQFESPRGICAVVGSPDISLATELAKGSELLVFVQLNDRAAVEESRRAVAKTGMLNSRIYIEHGSGGRVHLANNLADVVVAVGEAQASFSKDEFLRVVRPLGKVLLGSETLVKPIPEGLDDWSHPYHSPDNNPQSTDRMACAPYLTQFLAEPWYCPMPEVTVSAGGRVFKAFGSRAFRRPQWPMLNTLIAMNGYNGTILWQRPLDPGFMIHRNTMIATPDTLYLADAESCKLFDAATGELRDEIKVPEGISDGPVWKWMALEDGVLYALVGEEEPPGDALKGPAYRGAGWPWWEIPNYAWGFGRTIMALDTKDKRVLWSHRESEPLDTRTMCMKNGRIVFFSHDKFLGCLNAETGETLWKTDDQEILSAIGQRRPAQRAVWGFASSAFAKCNENAIYFAGPQQERLVAVSVENGKLLWQYRQEGNFQLVLRDDSLFAMGSSHPSRKLDLLSGEILHQLPNRAACTRATGTVDRIFVRGRGTKCWDVAENKWLHISPMRPACHDGVVVANGHLYWGPWMCGCNLSLVGVICLGPAGDFNHTVHAAQTERLESLAESPFEIAPLEPAVGDWPTYRKDSKRSTCVEQTISEKAVKQWEFTPPRPSIATAPVAVGGYVFVSGSDGIVRALNGADGESKWTAYTGGAIRVPPSIANGRAFVGSADGWIYAFAAANGRPLWRFRAAPVERKIPVYGSLSSTWPVGAGVLAENGRVYAAAGIANYDGTHVYALDAETGRLVWQNNTSGNTTGGQGAGVSVQGDLLAANGKLYLAGGNAIALASYNLDDGAFSRAPAAKVITDRRGPRGHDLFLKKGGAVSVSGSLPLYIRQEDVHYIDFAELTCPLGTMTVIPQALGLVLPNADDPAKPTPVWAARPFNENVAVVVAGNAVIVAGTNRQLANDAEAAKETYGITALDIRDGKPLWRHSLNAGPGRWGVAVDRDGRVLVSLRSGQVICFGPDG